MRPARSAGLAIADVDRRTGAIIWLQPIEGGPPRHGPPRQLTHFTNWSIIVVPWSWDGRRLAIAGSTTTKGIVLFKGLTK